jgi:glycosyltransferase involved in cell wall biosynthesis
MIAGRRVAVVIPAYNEARLIGETLRGVPSFVDDIIVVDDGSTDASAEIALASHRATEVIRHTHNQGVGAAIATGFNHALSLGADATAVMAADGQMDPLDLPALLAPLLADGLETTCSRGSRGKRLAWTCEIHSAVMSR